MTARLIVFLGALIVVLGALWGAYRYGVSVEHTRGQLAMEAQKKDLAQQAAKNLQAYADQVAGDVEAAREDERKRIAAEQETNVVYRTITQQVTKYVETHPDAGACGLDADGLRIWNDANRGGAAATPAPVAGK